MLFLLGPILSHLSFPSYGLQLGMFFFACVIVLLFSILLFLHLGCIIFLYLFCFFLLFYFSIPQVDLLPLPLEYGPSPRSLRMYGLACVSATLVGYSCLLRIFYLVLFLFQRFLWCMPWLCCHVIKYIAGLFFSHYRFH